MAAIRNRAGLSQDAVSEATGISRQHITKLENSVNSPTIDTLAAYLRACNSSLAEFFEAKIPTKYPNPMHQDIHDKLQAILDANANFSIGIELNINAIYSYLPPKRMDVTAGRDHRIEISRKRNAK